MSIRSWKRLEVGSKTVREARPDWMISTTAENAEPADAAAVNPSFPTVAYATTSLESVDILGPEHDRTALRISTVHLSALSRSNSDAATNAIAREGNTENDPGSCSRHHNLTW
jgi:hypothetical protein